MCFIQVASFMTLTCVKLAVYNLKLVILFFYMLHYIRDTKSVKSPSGQKVSGDTVQEDVYGSWVCMDHFCGGPVFCWVYNEIEKIFTPEQTVNYFFITGL